MQIALVVSPPGGKAHLPPHPLSPREELPRGPPLACPRGLGDCVAVSFPALTWHFVHSKAQAVYAHP